MSLKYLYLICLLMSDDHENHMLMLINCWILDHVCEKLHSFFNLNLWLIFIFQYV